MSLIMVVMAFAGGLLSFFSPCILPLAPVVYSLGLAIPFILLALGFEQVSRKLNRIKPYLKYLQWTAGGLLIVMGLLLVTNNLILISSWVMRITGGWNPEGLFSN